MTTNTLKKLPNRTINGTEEFEPANEKSGFTLIEVVIAMVILLVALLGVFVTFTWAITFNAGNDSRSEALAILQGEVEFLRSAKFTSGVMDTTLGGGTRAQVDVAGPSGNAYLVDVSIDDDPFTAGVQVNNNASLKEITVTVTLASPTPGWQTAVPSTVRFHRVRGN
ncbi:MAG: type II secretion system protein [Acidobacteria bacterium]|nr:MAG: type II secretion system protein [Acidobacteriota bacterium]REK01983.1 MAG: type II secretion system protein [Acidobacteriota bacterium]REK14940.1 MAG: type II secretion system protein [Acidobacteriota bacterium]REK45654.1 MAG: type II secretion system protein [Acidobacteriota bacterium]